MLRPDPFPVTAAVCLYNGSAFIGEALASVLAQTVSDFELLVVDDGSTDGAGAFLEAWIRDPRLTVVRTLHRGLGAARALAVSRARGEWIAFLDQDDVWAPRKLERFLEAAESRPEAAIVFSDARLMDEAGAPFGLWSDRFDLRSLDLGPGSAERELLQRGCFIDVSAAMVRRDAVLEAGNFDPRFHYVEDLDLWLRIARCRRLSRIPEPWSFRRIHAGQFTQAQPETALAEQMALLRPRSTDLSLPPSLRIAVGDYLLGQHYECGLRLLRHRRYGAAARVAFGAFRVPDRITDAAHCLLLRRGTPSSVRNAAGRALSVIVRIGNRLVRIAETLRGRSAGPTRIHIDGTPLGDERTGYFTFVTELIRSLIVEGPGAPIIRVSIAAGGRRALRESLGPPAGRLRLRRVLFGRSHWAAFYESVARPVVQILSGLGAASLILAGMFSFLRPLAYLGAGWALLQALFLADRLRSRQIRRRGGPPRPPLFQRAALLIHNGWWVPRRRGWRGPVIEIITWRGRFRFRRSRRIAFVPDLTTRIGPEWHTEANVREFDEYLAYALRYAGTLATVSEHSRKDIVERLGVPRERVSIAPSFIHPAFFSSHRSPDVLRGYGLEPGYLLSVSTIEPRKNLRRLVRAFERLRQARLGGPILALVGPPGWDEGFDRFLDESEARPFIRRLGFVPLEHLPSLYHHAAAFVYPSLYEGFGLPVLEAMASEAVVAASRSSSLLEVLGEAGILFDPVSDGDIEAALRRAVSLTPEEQASFRAAGRRRAEEMVAEWRRRGPWPLRMGDKPPCE
ncbi:MAG: glycosyltransferase [Candidatus Aminicenantes bacterium]|nr:glycosyltransferase [Candidatus Aminicenantes bacterium]